MKKLLRTFLCLCGIGVSVLPGAVLAADPLSSWNKGAAKDAVAFVTKAAKEIPEAERIAVLDNDGTLWSEQPMYFQLAFSFDRVKILAKQHPEWHSQEPFKSVLAGDAKGVAAMGAKGLAEILAATHAGMTTDEFTQIVRDWLKTAKHPRFRTGRSSIRLRRSEANKG